MAKKFYVVVASKNDKKVPLDEVVYSNTMNGTVARYATYDEALKIAEDNAIHDSEHSYMVLKTMAVFETVPRIVRKAFY